jgi:hypothetical protein
MNVNVKQIFFSNYTTINILINFQIKKYENGKVNVLRNMTM